MSRKRLEKDFRKRFEKKIRKRLAGGKDFACLLRGADAPSRAAAPRAWMRGCVVRMRSPVRGLPPPLQGFNLSTVRRSECLPGVIFSDGGMLRGRFVLSLTNLTPFAASALGRCFSCGLLFCPLWLVLLSVDNLHGRRRFVALWACFVALRAFLCVVGCVACRLSRLFCPVWRFVGWGCMFSRLACFRRFTGVFGASVAVCGFGSVSECLQAIKKGLQRANPL